VPSKKPKHTVPISPSPPTYASLFQSQSDSDDPEKLAPCHSKKEFWSQANIEHVTTQIRDINKFVTFLLTTEGTKIVSVPSRQKSAVQMRRQLAQTQAKRALAELHINTAQLFSQEFMNTLVQPCIDLSAETPSPPSPKKPE